MTVTELIECLQKLIAQRPDVAGMYVMLDDDPTLCVSNASVVIQDNDDDDGDIIEVVNIA
jgi:hypothetical protein